MAHYKINLRGRHHQCKMFRNVSIRLLTELRMSKRQGCRETANTDLYTDVPCTRRNYANLDSTTGEYLEI